MQRRKLTQLARLGVPFQRTAIAHELHATGSVSDLLPGLCEGPRTCTDDVARELVGPVPVHPGVARVVRLLGVLAGASTSAAATALNVVLDPIIFGVVGRSDPRHGEPALWFPLCAWRW